MDIKKNRVYVHTRICQYSLSPQLELPLYITKDRFYIELHRPTILLIFWKPKSIYKLRNKNNFELVARIVLILQIWN